MLVSWNWLSDYVPLNMPQADLVDRLTMSGLNHESTESAGTDYCIDLEVTSNRPDCLGHVGVAREIAALYRLPLTLPRPEPRESDVPIGEALRVSVECPDLCSRYTARVMLGVQVGPSPLWLRERLATLGVASVNNVVDITNYVMFECGQPLHAFDFQAIRGGRIVVRQPHANEMITAIDHRQYVLAPGDCVIADASRAVAIGGVMGGADSEIGAATRDLVIESACFSPTAVRNTARRLNLHSPSSFRFERQVDWHLADWASRRCCQLILEIAGGQLLKGCVDVGQPPPPPLPIHLRKRQIGRVLGLEISPEFTRDLLPRLGLAIQQETADAWIVQAPTWRADLQREIDLIEEIGRIYGYHHLPDDVAVPLSTSQKSVTSRVLDRVRRVVLAAGFDEAMTASMVPSAWSDLYSPWTTEPALCSNQPMLGVLDKASQNVGPVNCLRRSLVPSLLEARRINEYRSNVEIELFETAHVYLPRPSQLPREVLVLGLVSERNYLSVKGVLEAVVREAAPDCRLSFAPLDQPLFGGSPSAQIEVGGQTVGFLGEVAESIRRKLGIRRAATVGELDLTWLESIARLIPRVVPLSEFPAVVRDFNFIVADSVSWADLEACAQMAAGPDLESVRYRETFRDPQRDGLGRKRLLLSVQWRSRTETLTSAQIDAAADRIIQRCSEKLQAYLVS